MPMSLSRKSAVLFTIVRPCFDLVILNLFHWGMVGVGH